MFDDIMILGLCKKLIDESGGGGSVTPEEIQEAVDKYLEEHPVQPTPIDDTLSIAGEAADAKSVGDAIKELQEAIRNLRQLIIDVTNEEDVAEGIVDSGTENLTDDDVTESYNGALN